MSELVQRAEQIMADIEPALAEKFGTVFEFLESNPEAAQPGRKREFGSDEYIKFFATGFAGARHLRPPVCPATVPDSMVAVILEQFFSVPGNEVATATRHHNLAMGAENIIGNLLERYISQVLEPHGWAWCSGSLVRDIDFVHKGTDAV